MSVSAARPLQRQSSIAQLATSVLELDRQLNELEKLIADRFRTDPNAEIITSMIGIGDLLGAEFLAATGGTLSAFASADHLAGYAGLAPAPRDSSRHTGNLHRPRRYNRQLQRVFYTSSLISIQHSPASRAFYDRKRAEGKRHSQAVLALARRRANVLWAMLRDQTSTSNQRQTEPSPLDKKIENRAPPTHGVTVRHRRELDSLSLAGRRGDHQLRVGMHAHLCVACSATVISVRH